MFAVDDIVGGARLRLRPRAFCPHCRKVVSGRHAYLECAKLQAKRDDGCEECGEPIKQRKRGGRGARRRFCKACAKDRKQESAERSRARPQYRAREKTRHKQWRATPGGRQKMLEHRRAFTKRHPGKNTAWSRKWHADPVNREHRRKYLRAYYLANKEAIERQKREKRKGPGR